jgi:PmbA protein
MKTDLALSAAMVELALKKGASEAEVFQRASKMLSAEVKSGEVSAVESAVSMGYGIRVIADGRPGFYYSNRKDMAESAVEAALETARFAEREEHLSFPEPKKSAQIDVYDQEVASVSEEIAIDSAMSVEKTALSADPRVKRTRKALASFSAGETLVVNSKGISFKYPSTSVSAHIMTVAEEGGESQMGWGFGIGRFMEDIDFGAVGSEAAKRATMMLGARTLASTKSAVMLDNHIAADFLSIFSSMLSSENVQKGKSLLAGKVGQKVISGELAIIDDGLLNHGPGSRPIDDEGVPALCKTLVKNGVLEGFMYNSLTARREGRDSSGNAVRGRFSGVPSVGPLNLYIEATGEAVSPAEMIGSIKKGLYIIEAMGMHTANPISGQFSIGVSGLWIEDGKVAFPVKEAVISGNILDFFGRVVSVGDDLRFYGNIGAPSLLVGETDISG